MNAVNEPFLKYVIFLHAVPGAKLNKGLRRSHAEHLRMLDESGRLVLAGPFIEKNQGMIVINANSMDEARQIAEADPFVINGYRKYEILTLEYCCKDNNYRSPE